MDRDKSEYAHVATSLIKAIRIRHYKKQNEDDTSPQSVAISLKTNSRLVCESNVAVAVVNYRLSSENNPDVKHPLHTEYDE